MRRKGAIQWTVGRLIGVVIAVLVLVLGIYMLSSGAIPNIERYEGQFNKVLVSLKSGNVQEIFSNCHKEEVENYAGGRDFLKTLGYELGRVDLVFCPNAVCSFEGEGLNLYRVNRDNFEKLIGSDWNKYDTLMSGDFNEIKRNWKFYDAFYNLSSGLKDIYDSGISGSLIFYTKGGINQLPVYTIWKNGEWEVAESFQASSSEEGWVQTGDDKIEKKGSFFITSVTRKIFYRGTDTDKALDKFVEQVWSKGFFGNDKPVYWEVFSAEKPDEYYLKSQESQGQEIGTLINIIDKYNPIVAAEHRTHYNFARNRLRDDYDPWTRTLIASSGSTAYGPAQLTMGLARGYLDNGAIDWSNREEDYLKRFINQGWKFLAFGGGALDVGQVQNNLEKYNELGVNVNSEYDSRFDYGGVGELTSDSDKVLYRQVVSKMLDEIYERNGRSEDKLWREWRFGINNKGKGDVDYQNAFETVWNTEAAGVDSGDFDEIDSDTDVRNLKTESGKIISKLKSEAQIGGADVLNMDGYVSGKSLKIGGKDYALSVEATGDFPIVSFVYGNEKFGFAHDGNAKAVSTLLPDVGLKYFPVKIVKWNGSEWVEIGNDEYYRLPEKNFKGVFEASVSASYLKKVCR